MKAPCRPCTSRPALSPVFPAILAMLLVGPVPGASAAEVCLEELRGVCIKYGTRPEDPAPARPRTERPAPDRDAVREDALGLTRDERIRVQDGLRALGFLTGPSDGVFGPGTRRAIGRWQASVGQTQTGYLTEAGRTTLIEAGRSRTAEPVAPGRPAPAQDLPETLRAVGKGDWRDVEWVAVLERKGRAARLTVDVNNKGQALRFTCETTIRENNSIYCPLTQTLGPRSALRFATGTLPALEISSDGSLGGARFVFQ